jgi:hypothetical protein
MTAAQLFRHASVALARVAATAAAAWVAASFVRDGLVARDDLGALCQSAGAPWWCTLRMLIIRAFLNQAFSMASMALAALAGWRRSAWAAHLAIAVGVAGMVLYDSKWSVAGVMGGVLVLARLAGQWQENAESKQGG